MSTRCHIIVIGENKEKYFIYHHHDGYPEGVGEELKEILGSCVSFDHETILEKILAYDSQYEVDEGIHGDEEFIYYISTLGNDSVTLTCYPYDGLKIGPKVFYELFSTKLKNRSDLIEKYNTLEYDTKENKDAFMDGVLWSESNPSDIIIRKILEEAINTIPDLSDDIENWVKYIKGKLKNGG